MRRQYCRDWLRKRIQNKGHKFNSSWSWVVHNTSTHIRPRATSNTLSWNIKSVKSSHVCFARLVTACPDRRSDSRPSSTRDMIFKFEVYLIDRSDVDNLQVLIPRYVEYENLQSERFDSMLLWQLRRGVIGSLTELTGTAVS